MIKNIWKTHPLEINDKLFEGVAPFNKDELKEAKKSIFPDEWPMSQIAADDAQS